jgi:hypothetical protein
MHRIPTVCLFLPIHWLGIVGRRVGHCIRICYVKWTLYITTMMVGVRLMATGLSMVTPMMITYKYPLIFGAKILHEPAARMVALAGVLFVVSWRLMSVVTQVTS